MRARNGIAREVDESIDEALARRGHSSRFVIASLVYAPGKTRSYTKRAQRLASLIKARYALKPRE